MVDTRYVIKRTDQGGGYVAIAGQKNSYTNKVSNMRKFDTEQAARDDACTGNEIVVPLSEIIN